MIINYEDIIRLDKLVLDKMELLLNEELEPVLSWIIEIIKNSQIEQVFLLRLSYPETTLQVELLNYEGELLFIDFEKNPSVDSKLDQINLGNNLEDKAALTTLHFDKDISNTKCYVSSELVKEKYQKYNIKPKLSNFKPCYN